MTPEDLRVARRTAGLSRLRLATLAEVPEHAVTRFEGGQALDAAIKQRLMDALRAAGNAPPSQRLRRSKPAVAAGGGNPSR